MRILFKRTSVKLQRREVECTHTQEVAGDLYQSQVNGVLGLEPKLSAGGQGGDGK